MAGSSLPCDDFNLLVKVLYEMRKVDDAIVTELNEITPTKSFKNHVDAAERCLSFNEMVVILCLL